MKQYCSGQVRVPLWLSIQPLAEVFIFFSPLSLVPFDEDDKDDSVWFLDHDYLENMYGMFKKVNGKSEFLIACVGCVCVFKPGICVSLFIVKDRVT